MTRIEDYALLGDLQTAALVSRAGSVDWCCFPRFDSGACFAALLGAPEHGRWLLAPSGETVRSTRRYRHDTLILETIHETAEGSVRVIDFMPPRGHAPDIVRIVEGLERPRVDAVRTRSFASTTAGSCRGCIASTAATAARSPGRTRSASVRRREIHGEDFTTVSDFTIEPGQRISFVLTWFPSHEPPPTPVDAEEALAETETYWREWADVCRHAATITRRSINPCLCSRRSPITRRAESWRPRRPRCPNRSAECAIGTTGSAGCATRRSRWWRCSKAAIATNRRPGGEWLLRAVAGDPADVQIMYGVAGERRLDERELEWLPGFDGSRPVRIGNAASTQLQLDVYGELMDAAYQTARTASNTPTFGWSLI